MSERIGLQRGLAVWGFGFAVVASVSGLAFATGARTIDSSVTSALPSVVSAWRSAADGHAPATGVKLSPVVLRGQISANKVPVAGDEGFWLNANALTGGESTRLAVGEQMTIGGRSYVIAELRPLHSDALGAETPLSRHLTLVVAEETGAETTAPRQLRFLIDGAQTPSPDAPAAAAPVPAHRTL